MHCRCFLAGAVPDLASGAVGSAHHLWVGRVVWGWLLWASWQSGLLYDDNQTKVGHFAIVGLGPQVRFSVEIHNENAVGK